MLLGNGTDWLEGDVASYSLSRVSFESPRGRSFGRNDELVSMLKPAGRGGRGIVVVPLVPHKSHRDVVLALDLVSEWPDAMHGGLYVDGSEMDVN